MPITFEEVTGEIERAPQDRNGAAAPAAAPAAADLREQLEHELRLRAEREARLCAD